MKITQTVTFDSCHRLLGYSGNCKNLHGHSWLAEVEILSEKDLDSCGMLIDYRTIKQYFKDFLDHRAILNIDDPLVDILKKQDLPVTTINGNPTAENISKKVLVDLMLLANLDFNDGDKIKIIIHESSENSAIESYPKKE